MFTRLLIAWIMPGANKWPRLRIERAQPQGLPLKGQISAQPLLPITGVSSHKSLEPLPNPQHGELMHLFLALSALVLASILPSGEPRAQVIERIGDFRAWSAFTAKEGNEPVCFMSAQPTKAEGNYNRRGEIYALVSHRPAEKRRGEVSFVAGYTFKPDSVVEVSVDGARAFKLYTKDDGAWARDTATDKKLIDEMIKGSRMVVRGTSTRGTDTTDTYSLSGFTAAYRAINGACGY